MVLVYIILAAFIIYLILGAVYFCLAFVRFNIDEIGDIDSSINDFLDEYRPLIKEALTYMRSLGPQRVYTKSFDGLMLSAQYFDISSDKTIMLFHGYRSSAERDFSCAIKMYTEMGFNVLLVDERSHGKSEGKIITFGAKERRDVISWINYYINNINGKARIFISGMSMGAATVLLAAEYDLPENIKGIIADCGYTDPITIIKKVAKQSLHINATPLLPVINLYCRIFGGFSIYGVSTEKALKNTKLPILFIHGTGDMLVPFEMSEINFGCCASQKDILLVEGAGHGMSYLIDTPATEEKLSNFLKKYSKT